MVNKKSAIRHHIAPSVPLSLSLVDDNGARQLDFKLAFDFNSFSMVEDKIGINMLQSASDFFDSLSADKLRVALWAALQIHNEGYEGDEGLEIVGSYLSYTNAVVVAAALRAAFVAGLGPEVQKAIKDAEEAARAAEAAGVAGEVPLEATSTPA